MTEIFVKEIIANDAVVVYAAAAAVWQTRLKYRVDRINGML